MQQKKRFYTLLYIAIISSFAATLVSYYIPEEINDITNTVLPASLVRKISLFLSYNLIDFSSLTIGFIGILITFGLFAGISMLFSRVKNDAQG